MIIANQLFKAQISFMKKMAIIGAGATGLFLANFLKYEAKVTVFEKSYRVGGRASSRSDAKISFDHGAQFISIKNKQFDDFLKKLSYQGAVARWDGKFVSIDSKSLTSQNLPNKARYVGVPSMQYLFEFLSKAVDLRLRTYVDSIVRQNDNWILRSGPDQNISQFDWVILAIPPTQAIRLLQFEPKWFDMLNNLTMLPCISLMASIKPLGDMLWSGARIKNSPLGWVAFNNSKPLRPSSLALIAQSDYYWTKKNIDKSDGDIEAELIREIKRIAPFHIEFVSYDLKKWNYAVIEEPLSENFLIAEKRGLAVAGDWCIGGNIESSFRSARSLSDKFLREVI